MSLTAVTHVNTLYNPSLQIEQGAERHAVVEKVRLAQNKGLFCPHCLQRTGEKIPVRFRNSELRRMHFFHVLDSAGTCQHYADETEKHLAAKTAIQDRLLIEKGQVQVKLEIQLQINPALPFSRPDILVIYPNRATEAHEVQISYINSDQLTERTSRLKSNGVSKVSWYLYGNNYNQENRECLRRRGIDCYRLVFEKGDVARPRWTLDKGYIERAPLPNTVPIDRCANQSTASVPPQELLKPSLERAWQRSKPSLQPIDPYTGKTFVYAGDTAKLQKQFSDVTLTVLAHNGAFAQCKGSNEAYYQWVPLDALKRIYV